MRGITGDQVGGRSPWFKTVEAFSAPNGQLRSIDNDRSEPLFGVHPGHRVSAAAMIRRHRSNQEAWPVVRVVRSERPRERPRVCGSGFGRPPTSLAKRLPRSQHYNVHRRFPAKPTLRLRHPQVDSTRHEAERVAARAGASKFPRTSAPAWPPALTATQDGRHGRLPTSRPG